MTSCGFLHLPSHMVTVEPFVFSLLLKHTDGNVLKESLTLPLPRYFSLIGPFNPRLILRIEGLQ